MNKIKTTTCLTVWGRAEQKDVWNKLIKRFHTYPSRVGNVLWSSEEVLFPKRTISDWWVSQNSFAFSSRSIKTRERFSDKTDQSRFLIHLFVEKPHWSSLWNERSKMMLLNCRSPERCRLSICLKKYFQHSSLLTLRKKIPKFLTLQELSPSLGCKLSFRTFRELSPMSLGRALGLTVSRWFLSCCHPHGEQPALGLEKMRGVVLQTVIVPRGMFLPGGEGWVHESPEEGPSRSSASTCFHFLKS